LLLVVKWIDFSGNTKESYQMIHEFQKLNIEVRAIEQPLDLNVPESNLTLAIYLASRKWKTVEGKTVLVLVE
jgi:site-specific DNA recombinase